jgi:hypothetical protein
MYSGHTVLGGLFWGLLSLTCAFNSLRFFWVWLLFGHSFITLSIYLLIYVIGWIIPKMFVYHYNKYYPSGLEGKLEQVNPYTLKQLLSPVYFPFTYAYYGKNLLKRDWRWWHTRVMGLYGLYPISIMLTIPFVTLAVFTLIPILQGYQPKLAILIALMLIPSLDKKYRPRNSVFLIPIIGYYLGISLGNIPQIWLYLGTTAFLAGFLYKNRQFVLTIKRRYIARVTSQKLDRLPKDGVICEGFIAHAIAYNSRKRVVIFTENPNYEQAKYETDLAIKEFDLNYAVFSDNYIFNYSKGLPAIDYIKTFKLIDTIKEVDNTYYIYEIPCFHLTTHVCPACAALVCATCYHEFTEPKPAPAFATTYTYYEEGKLICTHHP